MSKFFAVAGLAASIIAVAVAPAQAQQGKPDKDGQCPPGQNANGPYCETRGPVKNCPPGTQPQGVYCESVGNRGGSGGGVAGASERDRALTPAEIAEFKQDAAGALLGELNAILRRSGLPALRANQILISNTTTGFVVTPQGLTAKAANLFTATGLPVAVIGCVVRSCPSGWNVRVDFARRTLSAAATSRRLYMPQRNVVLGQGRTVTIRAKAPRTKRARGKASGARSVTTRVVTRTRNAPNGSVINRTVKTVKVRLVK